MADISIEFIGRQLQNIQAELGEIKFAAEVERRNNRSAFDNLVTEVGVKLGTFEAKIDHRLGSMDERLGVMEERLGVMEERLGVMEKRLDHLESIDGRLETVVEGVETLHRKFDRIEQLLTSRGASS